MMNAFSVLRVFIAVIVVSGFNAGALAQAPRPPAAPVMTEELMGRLIKFIRTDKAGSVSARICKALDLCDGTADLPLKIGKSDSTDGIHYFGVPVNPNSKDVLIMVKHDMVIVSYLTDKTGKLRAAAVLDNQVARLITNEKAAAGFKAELLLFAKEAAEQLPPTK